MRRCRGVVSAYVVYEARSRRLDKRRPSRHPPQTSFPNGVRRRGRDGRGEDDECGGGVQGGGGCAAGPAAGAARGDGGAADGRRGGGALWRWVRRAEPRARER